MSHRDSLHRFLFERLAARGQFIRLDASWQTVLERRDYPPVVRQILGEAMAAAALLSATIKFDGLLTLQIQSQGSLRLLAVQVTSKHTLRGLARWDSDPQPQPLRELCSDGTLVLTIDPGTGHEPYQGMVKLQGDTLAEALEDYFVRSEQLPTRIHLTADTQTAAGLLLQQLPGATSADPDAWNRLGTLAATIQDTELLTLDAPTLIQRLFHEDDLRIFTPESFRFRCNCSRERTAAMLRALGEIELRQILDARTTLHIDCEFCGHRYAFEPIDIAGLSTVLNSTSVKTRH
ncbi:MAG: Hsp33 family molecular chaperone HslO [Candidatus Contendobacter odensis]|uniref:Hsp33 family molecular chaperone HslO n=1 Tax=Candidatus Contendibacter odensensis TaxID=1400860 RepID=A0A2G6PEC7_9GAMM|nr:MAG: Hsp33 family molecular chaperone HslO [Candidatus Contendobacter odensis]